MQLRRYLALAAFASAQGTHTELLTSVVVALSLPQLLYILWRQLRPFDRECQFAELAGEGEWYLVILIVHRRAGIGADVEVLIPLQYQRQRVFHRLRCHRRAVDLQDARTALTDAAYVVEGERTHAEAVVFEVELQSVLAGRQHLSTFPAHAFQVDQVPQEHRLAFQHVEAVATEATALGHDHAFGAPLRDLHLGFEVVG